MDSLIHNILKKIPSDVESLVAVFKYHLNNVQLSHKKHFQGEFVNLAFGYELSSFS